MTTEGGASTGHGFLVPTNPGTLGLLAQLELGKALRLQERTILGRAVRTDEGLKIPAEWVQYSSTHAKVERASEGYFVIDSSTNGTFINDVKLVKGASQLLQPGDILRLSQASQPVSPTTSANAAESVILEFRFEDKEGAEGNQERSGYTPASKGAGLKRKVSEDAPKVEQQPSGLKRQATTAPPSAAQTPVAPPGGDGPLTSPAAAGTVGVPVQAPFTSPAVPAAGHVQAAVPSPYAGAQLPAGVQHPAQPARAAEPRRMSAGGDEGVKSVHVVYQANKDLRAQLQELRAQLQEQRHITQKAVAGHEAALRLAQAQHKEELAKVQERLSEAGAQLNQQALQLASKSSVEGEVQDVKGKLSAANEELTTLRAEAWSLKSELCKSHAAEQTSTQQLAELTQAVAQAKTDKALAEADAQAARAALSSEAMVLATTRRSLDERTQELLAVQQELTAVRAECEGLRQQLLCTDTTAAELDKLRDEKQELIERQAVTAMQTAVAARFVQADVLSNVSSFAEYIRGMQGVHDRMLLLAQQGPAMVELCNAETAGPSAAYPAGASAAHDVTQPAPAAAGTQQMASQQMDGGRRGAVQPSDIEMRFNSPSRTAAPFPLAGTQAQHPGSTQQLAAPAGPGHSPAVTRDGLAAAASQLLLAGTQVAFHPPAHRGVTGQPPPYTPTRSTLPSESLHTQLAEQAPSAPMHPAGSYGGQEGPAPQSKGPESQAAGLAEGCEGSASQAEPHAAQEAEEPVEGEAHEPTASALQAAVHAGAVGSQPGAEAMEVDQEAMQQQSSLQPLGDQHTAVVPQQPSGAAPHVLMAGASQPLAGAAPQQPAASVSQQLAGAALEQPVVAAAQQEEPPATSQPEHQVAVAPPAAGSQGRAASQAAGGSAAVEDVAHLDNERDAAAAEQMAPPHPTPPSLPSPAHLPQLEQVPQGRPTPDKEPAPRISPAPSAAQKPRFSIQAALAPSHTTPTRESTRVSAGSAMAVATTPHSHTVVGVVGLTVMGSLGMPATGGMSMMGQGMGEMVVGFSEVVAGNTLALGAAQPVPLQPATSDIGTDSPASNDDLPDSEYDQQHQQQLGFRQGPSSSAYQSGGCGLPLGLGREPSENHLADLTNMQDMHMRGTSSACDGSQVPQPRASLVTSSAGAGEGGEGGDDVPRAGRAGQPSAQGAMPSGGDGAAGGEGSGCRALAGSQAGRRQVAGSNQEAGGASQAEGARAGKMERRLQDTQVVDVHLASVRFP